MLYFNLKPIFDAKGIENPYSYLVKNGFTYHSAHYIANNLSRIFKLDHIEKLCDLLQCEPNDLLAWKPDNNKVYPENYPLKKLLPLPPSVNIKVSLQNIPYRELLEITQKISKTDTLE